VVKNSKVQIILHTRPTTLRVREAIFNILNKRVENSNWLDLFSGTGAISCEAYNHGASKIIAIEKNKINSKICLENLLSLENIENRRNDIEVICKDVLKWTKPNYDRNLSSRNMDLNKFKFDFVSKNELIKYLIISLLVRLKSIGGGGSSPNKLIHKSLGGLS